MYTEIRLQRQIVIKIAIFPSKERCEFPVVLFIPPWTMRKKAVQLKAGRIKAMWQPPYPLFIFTVLFFPVTFLWRKQDAITRFALDPHHSSLDADDFVIYFSSLRPPTCVPLFTCAASTVFSFIFSLKVVIVSAFTAGKNIGSDFRCVCVLATLRAKS